MRTRLLALLGYAMQAALALGSVIIVAGFLSPAEFSRYSVDVAIAQFAAIAGFEWVRIAVMRFYPGIDGAQKAIESRNIRQSTLYATGLVIAAAGCAALAGVGAVVMLTILPLILAQAASDLHQTMVRFRGELARFTRMQMVRSFLLFATTVSAAWIGGTAAMALLGLTVGHLAAIVSNLMIDRKPDTDVPPASATSDVRNYASYGMPAAAASVLHGSVAVAIRTLLIALLGEARAAGILLALDLFQRPLALAAIAINGVLYPDVIREHREARNAGAAKKRLYVVNFAALAAVSIVLLVWSPELARYLVRPDLQVMFLLSAPWLIVFFLLRSVVQNIFSVRSHLQLRPWNLALTGSMDLALAAGALSLSAFVFQTDIQTVMAWLMLSAVLLFGCIFLWRYVQGEPMPKRLVVLCAIALVISAYMGTAITSASLLQLAIKLIASVMLTVLVALCAFRTIRSAQ